ncbi:MAG: hypothetical protein ACJ79A_02700 [Gemmatimonadaceae bacterium]
MSFEHAGQHVRVLALAGVLLSAAACSDSATTVTTAAPSDQPAAARVEWAGDPELAKLIAQIRAATEQYHDVDVSFAAGYRPSRAGCESSAEGAMGIHYGHPGLLGLVIGSVPTRGTDPVIDPLRPEILMYEPQADGSRRLVGIEFVVYRAAWDAVHHEPPTLLGIPFDQRFGINAHGHADHYELHLWLWRHNPLGMFAPWNPKVSCSL